MLDQVIADFRIEGQVTEINPFGSGHIHKTYKVRTDLGTTYLLQSINHRVFKDVAGMMTNIHEVTSYLQKSFGRNNHDQETLELIRNSNGRLYAEHEGFWRVYHFKEHLRQIDIPESDDQVYQGARSFGMFLSALQDFETSKLTIVLKDFHDLEIRLQQLATAKNQYGTLDATTELKFVDENMAELLILRRLASGDVLPIRVVHNDTKFNNVLLDEQGIGRCVIDLDTVMPGIVHYDFGDGIRTTASTAAEDEADLHKVEIDIHRYQAFAEGYREATSEILTNIEIENLHLAGAYMAFIMGVRFLTDYLSGNVYYPVDFEGHNLQRARCQFELTRKLLQRKNELKSFYK